ncbi:hypothetical protein E2562_034553 [Oryza meyeriana var. granulata]|uniref:Uncharacterized protein n=1 Tax=Oryza meyeriana var. granulata TaxID=110450 RepID=A0A6G1ECD1_9ORYZ|nr:hypothetical protein E2562_034553 [Oryza meyeriana var. granulata]
MELDNVESNPHPREFKGNHQAWCPYSLVVAMVLGHPVTCGYDVYLKDEVLFLHEFFWPRLMFNPYAEKIYDYFGGIVDIKKAKVRTVIPPGTSFQDDCARILRAIRSAARLGFNFPKETTYYVRTLACSVARLDKVKA